MHRTRVLGEKEFIFLSIMLLMVCLTNGHAQNNAQDDKKVLPVNATDTIRTDTTKVVEDAPLDIAQDRGLFIIAPDGKMQLRILGSVRYLLVFDELDLSSKNGFNTYEIPTGDLNQSLPNYYNGLDQTRLGFEITRETPKGNVFIRLETDFAGANGFRIRHAYGQFRQFLFGQTWSLFSHLNASPATVDFAGPTSSLVTRTPQVRYSAPGFYRGINLAISLEYVIPNLSIPDSTVARAFQLIPDITARLDKTYSWGSAQLSGKIPILSGRDNQGDFVLKPGWGISASVVVNSWQKGKWYVQGVAGVAISRYFNELSTDGFDLIVGPDGRIFTPLTYGFYGTYEHRWAENLYSNFTYGWVQLEEYEFTEDNTYRKGHSLRANTFWDITEGAKIGTEIIWGNRVDKNDQKGGALRFNLLFYYDF